jgi:hypothetical protein
MDLEALECEDEENLTGLGHDPIVAFCDDSDEFSDSATGNFLISLSKIFCHHGASKSYVTSHGFFVNQILFCLVGNE